MDNETKSSIAMIYAFLTYAATFISFITGNGIFPSSIIGWIFFVGGILVAPIMVSQYNEDIERERTRERNNTRSIMRKEVNNIPNFDSSQVYKSFDENTQFLIDEKRKKISFYIINNKPVVYNYKDILKSEVLQDGRVISSTNRGSQLGGALLGGILAGGVGAAIGGLTGSKTSEDQIEKITLQVIVNDTSNPVYKLVFFESNIPMSKEYVKNYLLEAERCHHLISVLIKQADHQDTVTEHEKDKSEYIKSNNQTNEEITEEFQHNSKEINQQKQPHSLTEELSKLKTMLDENIITKEEFSRAKKKILED